MLHIYILTFISEELKALYTRNTWPGLAPCHTETEGKRITGVRASSKDNTVHRDHEHEGQFHNLIFSVDTSYLHFHFKFNSRKRHCLHYSSCLLLLGLLAKIKCGIHPAYAKTDCQTIRSRRHI